MIAAGLLARSVHPLPGLLVAYGRYAATRIGQADIIYVGEGLNASVAVSELSNGVRNYHNAGKVQASSEPQDMRLQRMLGHLTTLIPPQAKKVLVIGCGAGVTAGAVSVDPVVEHETIAEIEPLVPKVVSTYFAEHNFDVVQQPEGPRPDRRCAALRARRRARSSTRSPRTRSIRGSRARRCSTPSSSSRWRRIT